MAPKKLTDDVKVFITQAVACFDSPSAVVSAVNDEFGVTISRQQVERYDPTKRAGKDLSKKLKIIFEETRKTFIEKTADIGWWHQAARLRMIQRVGERAEKAGNLDMVLRALEQAAKEVGENYTNRQRLEHTGKDGKDLPPPPAPVNIFQLPDNGRASAAS